MWGVGKKRGDARGETQRQKSGGWRPVINDPVCGAPIRWLAHGLDEDLICRCLSSSLESFNRSTCTWRMIYLLTATRRQARTSIRFTNPRHAIRDGKVGNAPWLRLLDVSSAPASRPLYWTSTNQTFFRRPYISSNRKTLSMRVYICSASHLHIMLSLSTWTSCFQMRGVKIHRYYR